MGVTVKYPPSVAGAVLLERSWLWLAFLHVALAGAYAVVFSWVYYTAGGPWENTVEEIRRLRALKVALGAEPKLPSPYLPSAFALAGLISLVAFHFAALMLPYWSPDFDARANYREGARARPGAYIRMIPHPNRGQPEIAQLVATGERLLFRFARLQYEVIDSSDGLEIRVLSCPDDWNLSKYCTYAGLYEKKQKELEALYGKNVFDIPVPQFVSLFLEEALSPVSLFQFFFSFLWCLDGLWRYTATQVLLVVAVEAWLASGRKKSMSRLRVEASEYSLVWCFRDDNWEQLPSFELLPGDLFVLPLPQVTARDDNPSLVPCDAVVIAGTAVINEASLTGESVPQLKEPIPRVDRALNADDTKHTIFSGTKLVSVSAGATPEQLTKPSPVEGMLCVSIRTGFYSTQGELMRMLEVSQDRVGDSLETTAALAVLLGCALAFASYVMRSGLAAGDRSHYDLVLRCVLVVTSVVPPLLPLQLAFALNRALGLLGKRGVYCTEPFRLALAGSVDVALFDKTGTITTDSLIPAGVALLSDEKNSDLTSFDKAPEDMVAVLAGCHSLMDAGGKLAGDPIELTAFEALNFTWDQSSQTASRGRVAQLQRDIAESEEELGKLAKLEAASNRPGLGGLNEFQKGEQKRLKKLIADRNSAIEATKKAKQFSVQVLHRYAFQSELQRMSSIADVTSDGKTSRRALVKGSPEAIKKLLATVPPRYDETFVSLANSGIRVLALATKRLSADANEPPRKDVESGLEFMGFVAFRCLLRSDSKLVIKALQENGVDLVMLTGDATLTANWVADEVALFDPLKGRLHLVLGGDGQPAWQPPTGEKPPPPLGATIPELAKANELLVTEQAWTLLAEKDPSVWSACSHIKVWARCTPSGKANLIRALNRQGRRTLMCGDGGNDVGALKQAHVGVALLSGFGNANTKVEELDETDGPEAALEKLYECHAKRASEAKQRETEKMASKQKVIAAKTAENLEKLVKSKEEAEGGELSASDSVRAMMGAAMLQTKESVQEHVKEAQRFDNAVARDAALFANAMTDDEDIDVSSMVAIGDASIAAPFTNWSPSIGCVLTVLRQGRCTVLTSLQQSQIMIIGCLLNAFSIACLSVYGVRSSEKQMMMSAILMAVASFAFAFATPVPRLHKVRPHTSLFHPAISLSVALQVIVHLCCMGYAVHITQEEMGDSLKDVAAAMLRPPPEIPAETYSLGFKQWDNPEDPWWEDYVPELAELIGIVKLLRPSGYEPNLLNTVVYLVGMAQQCAMLLVNYKGRPWMKGATENMALWGTLAALFASIGLLIYDVNPEVTAMFDLQPFPSEEFRRHILLVVVISLAGTFGADRAILMTFSPDVFAAQTKQMANFRPSDIMSLQSLGICVASFIVLKTRNYALGGILVMHYLRWKFDTKPDAIREQINELEAKQKARDS
jgi:cation-transporting ATPase 13A1